MVEVVINDCFGGFRLSDEGFEWLIKHKKWTVTTFNKKGNYKNKNADICRAEDNFMSMGMYYFARHSPYDKELRTNKDLIECIKKLKKRANTYVSEFKIINIPDDVDWHIEEYDGSEWVAEDHRTWR